MGFDLEVDTDAVRAHAADVSGIAARIGDATSAAGEALTMGPHAFGILCSFLTLPANAVQGLGLVGIAGSQAVVGGLGNTLTSIADNYDAVDQATAGRLTKFIESL
ncbi:type VII secretion target [Occultella kanbiaonis]|uniref:type VII secretion target n=1 Tax=Occultella kanbiaonis TaxID=2675754 RepID=UPI0012B9128B|nr:type VII secretion target [Occultella kanbiaonis]